MEIVNVENCASYCYSYDIILKDEPPKSPPTRSTFKVGDSRRSNRRYIARRNSIGNRLRTRSARKRKLEYNIISCRVQAVAYAAVVVVW